MEVWKKYMHQKCHHKKVENVQNVNKYLKKRDSSYDEIRNHVLETPESKENSLAQVVGGLKKKKINIKI